MSTTNGEVEMLMHNLIFKNDKAGTLAKMMEHSNANKRKLPYVQEETEDQGLWLVKDKGIYLMSPTEENFVNGEGVRNTVVYARGYKPTKANRDTLWDKTYAVSHDDFVEFITLSPDMVRNVLNGGTITIELNETEMAVTA
jgi:hypothetical protein